MKKFAVLSLRRILSTPLAGHGISVSWSGPLLMMVSEDPFILWSGLYLILITDTLDQTSPHRRHQTAGVRPRYWHLIMGGGAPDQGGASLHRQTLEPLWELGGWRWEQRCVCLNLLNDCLRKAKLQMCFVLLEAAIVNMTQLPTLKNGYSFDSQTRKGCHLMVELCTVVSRPRIIRLQDIVSPDTKLPRTASIGRTRNKARGADTRWRPGVPRNGQALLAYLSNNKNCLTIQVTQLKTKCILNKLSYFRVKLKRIKFGL